MAQDKIKMDQSATLLDQMAMAALIGIYSGEGTPRKLAPVAMSDRSGKDGI